MLRVCETLSNIASLIGPIQANQFRSIRSAESSIAWARMYQFLVERHFGRRGGEPTFFWVPGRLVGRGRQTICLRVRTGLLKTAAKSNAMNHQMTHTSEAQCNEYGINCFFSPNAQREEAGVIFNVGHPVGGPSRLLGKRRATCWVYRRSDHNLTPRLITHCNLS